MIENACEKIRIDIVGFVREHDAVGVGLRGGQEDERVVEREIGKEAVGCLQIHEFSRELGQVV